MACATVGSKVTLPLGRRIGIVFPQGQSRTPKARAAAPEARARALGIRWCTLKARAAAPKARAAIPKAHAAIPKARERSGRRIGFVYTQDHQPYPVGISALYP